MSTTSGTKYTELFRIRTSEINPDKVVHPHALISLMQEASMQHTISMKVSVWDLTAISGSWVLLRMQVKFIRYPGLNDTLRIETYPSGLEGYFTYRDFLAYDADDRLCATISSMWTMMNTETRKMMKIPYEYDRLIYSGAIPLEKPDFKVKPITDLSDPVQVRINYFHLDWNGHINNVRLINILLETLETDLVSNHQLLSLNIQYKNEVGLDEEVLVYHSTTDALTRVHLIRHKDTGQDIILAESVWTKNNYTKRK